MIFPANIAVEQRVMMVAIVIAFFIFTRFRYTPSHVQWKPSSCFSLRQGLQSSLSEGHISSCTIVRTPDILHMFLDMLQCTKSTNFSHMYYFFIIHKMSLRRNEIISRAGFGRWAVVLRPCSQAPTPEVAVSKIQPELKTCIYTIISLCIQYTIITCILSLRVCKKLIKRLTSRPD